MPAGSRALSVDSAISTRAVVFRGAGSPTRRRSVRQTDSTSSFAPSIASLGVSFASRCSRPARSSINAKSSERVTANELAAVFAGLKTPSAKAKPSLSAAFTSNLPSTQPRPQPMPRVHHQGDPAVSDPADLRWLRNGGTAFGGLPRARRGPRPSEYPRLEMPDRSVEEQSTLTRPRTSQAFVG